MGSISSFISVRKVFCVLDFEADFSLVPNAGSNLEWCEITDVVPFFRGGGGSLLEKNFQYIVSTNAFFNLCCEVFT